MCIYCNMGDWQFKYNPPFIPSEPHPLIPQPFNPQSFVPWPLPQLQEFHDLLKRVKELEDKAGCPCEPNKADYLKIIGERIKEMREMG